ncbi:hypothetical protein T4D_1784 [Trichinella pseudospiralis]|uniref:Uncharacterized protein n=1 Tax=Trichinella pseudospiralis TaxID=6337 RepID=A0A0V1G5J0_TRIPS|nr:hypothetical protein T4D_1784 [Trichinella pseudospiralis]
MIISLIKINQKIKTESLPDNCEVKQYFTINADDFPNELERFIKYFTGNIKYSSAHPRTNTEYGTILDTDKLERNNTDE